jgi:hypothetical protein
VPAAELFGDLPVALLERFDAHVRSETGDA